VDQAIEDVDPLDPASNRRRRHRGGPGGIGLQVDAAVRATSVVVLTYPVGACRRCRTWDLRPWRAGAVEGHSDGFWLREAAIEPWGDRGRRTV
jgi:hypothetical protein